MPATIPGRLGALGNGALIDRVRPVPALVGALVTIEILLVSMHFISPGLMPPLNRLQIWFDLSREGTIAAWFASSQLLVVGIALGLVGASRQKQNRPSRAFFVFLGLMFAYISLDEAVAIHERVTEFTIRHAWVPRFRGGHGVWIFLYAILAVLVVALMRRDLAAFWHRYRIPARTMLAGFGLTVAGGVGLEIGYYGLEDRTPPVVERILAAGEEFLEMVGTTVVLLGVILLGRRVVRLQSID
jgi:hypothetical protein